MLGRSKAAKVQTVDLEERRLVMGRSAGPRGSDAEAIFAAARARSSRSVCVLVERLMSRAGMGDRDPDPTQAMAGQGQEGHKSQKKAAKAAEQPHSEKYFLSDNTATRDKSKEIDFRKGL